MSEKYKIKYQGNVQECAHVLVGGGESKIWRVGWQAGTQDRTGAAGESKDSLLAEIPLPQGAGLFLKASN